METVVKTAESHDWIRVAYTIAFIDSWDVDYLSFQINDVPLKTTLRTYGRPVRDAQCSSDAWGRDRFATSYTTFLVEFPHSEPTVKLTWVDTLD